jgi:ATP-binding cassette subfamily C protein/ATP-binding cassette subfamily C protein LapB
MTAAAGAVIRKDLPLSAGMRILSSFQDGGADALSQYAHCVIPLLNALGWRGDHRHVAEAVPHFTDNLDLDGFRAVMANLNYALKPVSTRLDRLARNMVPCLFVPETGSVRVIVDAGEDGVLAFDAGTRTERLEQAQKLRGIAYVAKPVEGKDKAAKRDDRSWVLGIMRRFNTVGAQALALTGLFNLLSMATPLFIMVVYDSVIPSGSTRQLLYFVAGILMALGLELWFRWLRSRSLAYIGGRIDHLVGSAAFQQVLYLPPMYTETAPIGGQMARLKEFESIREFFTGPLAESLLDLPFLVLFLAVIGIVGGPLVLVPICIGILFVLLHLVLAPVLRRMVRQSNHIRSDLQQFLVETLGNVRTVKFLGAEKLWRDRYRRSSAEAAIADFRYALMNHVVQTAAQVLMLAAGIALMALGALQVIDGDMSMGGLIAVMALGWRALSPIQSGFLALGRVEQIRSAIRQIDNLMRVPIERVPGTVPPRRTILGGITFSFVSHRYNAESDPVLFGVNFDIKPGEVVALTGHNGSGKSTAAKLAAGLYRSQTGAVLIDGVDIRQIDPIDLRQSIAFVPQVSHFFYGTISQNMRLAVPAATDGEIEAATIEARVHDEILALPEAYATRLSEQTLSALPSGFKQKLALARAYVREAPILILDEPGQALDEAGDQALMETIERLRGTTTVIIVTHRPSHMRIADRLIVMNAGKVQFDGKPEEFLDGPGPGGP